MFATRGVEMHLMEGPVSQGRPLRRHGRRRG
jgi:hypothetical protein